MPRPRPNPRPDLQREGEHRSCPRSCRQHLPPAHAQTRPLLCTFRLRSVTCRPAIISQLLPARPLPSCHNGLLLPERTVLDQWRRVPAVLPQTGVWTTARALSPPSPQLYSLHSPLLQNQCLLVTLHPAATPPRKARCLAAVSRHQCFTPLQRGPCLVTPCSQALHCWQALAPVGAPEAGSTARRDASSRHPGDVSLAAAASVCIQPDVHSSQCCLHAPRSACPDCKAVENC